MARVSGFTGSGKSTNRKQETPGNLGGVFLLGRILSRIALSQLADLREVFRSACLNNPARQPDFHCHSQSIQTVELDTGWRGLLFGTAAQIQQ
jgi:hypothetical protein